MKKTAGSRACGKVVFKMGTVFRQVWNRIGWRNGNSEKRVIFEWGVILASKNSGESRPNMVG